LTKLTRSGEETAIKTRVDGVGVVVGANGNTRGINDQSPKEFQKSVKDGCKM